MLLNDCALMRAYRATDDAVAAAPLTTLRPGEDARGAAFLLERHGALRGAFVTGRNPFSERRGDNQVANNRLARAIAALGRRALHAVGAPRAGTWEPEAGFLVLDCTEDEARDLAYGAGQNAYLWVERGAVPEVRPTVPGLIVVATRRASRATPDVLACLTEEAGGTLRLSLRRYRVLARAPLFHGNRPFPPRAADDVVTGWPTEEGAVVLIGGPLEPVPDVPAIAVDPGNLGPAAGWFWGLGRGDGADRLRHVLVAATGAEAPEIPALWPPAPLRRGSRPAPGRRWR